MRAETETSTSPLVRKLGCARHTRKEGGSEKLYCTTVHYSTLSQVVGSSMRAETETSASPPSSVNLAARRTPRKEGGSEKPPYKALHYSMLH